MKEKIFKKPDWKTIKKVIYSQISQEKLNLKYFKENHQLKQFINQFLIKYENNEINK